MRQNFSKSKNLHESSKWQHFQWGDENFGPLRKPKFSIIIIFPAFWDGGKNLPNRLEKKYAMIV